MNAFTDSFLKLLEEEESLRKREVELKIAAQMHNEKMFGFLKEHGLPENFGMLSMAKLVAEKYEKSSILLAPK